MIGQIRQTFPRQPFLLYGNSDYYNQSDYPIVNNDDIQAFISTTLLYIHITMAIPVSQHNCFGCMCCTSKFTLAIVFYSNSLSVCVIM